jgi:hypothetical protein
VVHRARAGQGWQVALANRAMMILVPLLRAVSVVKLFGPTDRREFRPRLGGLGV